MSPLRSDVLIAPTVASSARPAAAFEMSACRAIASIISDLFTKHPFRNLACDAAAVRRAAIGNRERAAIDARSVALYSARVFRVSRLTRHTSRATHRERIA